MYARGEGVAEDLVIAFMWLSLSEAHGEDATSQAKTILRDLMTSEQISEAQKLSVEWVEEHK